MNCKKCDHPIGPNDAFCPNCGELVETQSGEDNQNLEQQNVESENNQASIEQVEENIETPTLVNSEVDNTSTQPPVSEPIMPKAPEAPLPGTQSIPVVDPATESSVQNPVTSVTSIPVENVQTQIQGAPTVDPTLKTSKKSNPIFITTIIVLGVFSILLIFLLGGKNMLGGNKNNSTSSSTSSSTTSSTRPAKKEEITLSGVKIFVPYSFKVDPLSTQELGIINNDSQQTQIYVYPLPAQKFDDYVIQFDALAGLIATDEITVLSSEQKTVGERLFLNFVISINGKEENLCYTNIRDGSVIRFELVQAGMSLDAALNIFSEIAEFAVPEAEIQPE